MTVSREEFEELKGQVNLLVEALNKLTKTSDQKITEIAKNINKALYGTEKLMQAFDQIIKNAHDR